MNNGLDTSFSPWPCYADDEIEAVNRVLLSNKVNYWTGNECRQFEDEFSLFAGTKYAVAVMNGSVALELALIALGVGAGDEVIVTSRTFVASASSIVNIGAVPIFADVDPNSQNITEVTIQKVISDKTKAIICVHLAGWPCDMDPIMRIADASGISVIEDCAQAHGAIYKERSVGSIGHIGCWSFCQDKIISTGGEGGMVTTDDYDLWKKMWEYKDHGKNWDSINRLNNDIGFKWVHDTIGTNWRMTEIQAAIGRVQLRKLEDWTAKRQKHGNHLEDCQNPS